MQTFKYSMMREVTPEEIYRMDNIYTYIPAEYEVVDFRPPSKGEYYLTYNSSPSVVKYLHIDCFDLNTPRLILRKKQEVISPNTSITLTVEEIYGGPVTIPEGWKFKEFDLPKADEHFISRTEDRSIVSSSLPIYSPRIIITRV